MPRKMFRTAEWAAEDAKPCGTPFNAARLKWEMKQAEKPDKKVARKSRGKQRVRAKKKR